MGNFNGIQILLNLTKIAILYLNFLRVQRGSVRVQCGSVTLQPGSDGSALACCMAGPSSNPSSPPQGRFFPLSKTSNEDKERGLGKWI
jgi:hypothetical protein